MAVTTVFYTNYRELSVNYQFLSWDALRVELWGKEWDVINSLALVGGNRKSLLGQARKRFSSLCKENIEVTGVLILVLACFLVLLEEFLLNIARNEFVASELH